MELVKFKEVNLEDPFFDSLKADYKGFEEWFGRKAIMMHTFRKK